MNRKNIVKTLGRLTAAEGFLMLLPALVSLCYGEMRVFYTFLAVSLGTLLISIPVSFVKTEDKEIYAKEGFVIVGAVWIIWSLIGALPFYITKEIPSFIDALFETVSGFSTTGASILNDIEALSYGLLFWRSFTHWIGGMGVLIFVMSIIKLSDNNSMHLMRAEVPGPTVGKLVPKGMTTAKILYGIYLVMTIAEIVLLYFGGMPLFDSVVHSFATAGTGGFSIKNAGIAYYDSAYIEGVLTVFMILFGINFNMYYFIAVGKISQAWKNSEWKVYFGIIAASIVAIIVAILPQYQSFTQAFRYASFQVASIISSTGFTTADYTLWPTITQTIIIVLMFIGASASSTGGGLKVGRVMIAYKAGISYMARLFRPRSIKQVKIDGRIVPEETVNGTMAFLMLYIAVFCTSLVLVSFNNLGFETSFSATLTCINNIGPGLGSVGPVNNFSALSDFSKFVLSFDMLLGRLEILPVLAIFQPALYNKRFV